MLLFVLVSVYIVTDWIIYSHPHTSWNSLSWTFHPLSYLYVYLSKAEYVSQSRQNMLANHAQLLES